MNRFKKLFTFALVSTLGLSAASAQTDQADVVQRQKINSPESLVQQGFTTAVYYNSMNQLKADKDVEFGSNLSGMRWKNLSYDVEQVPGLALTYQRRSLNGFGFSAGGYFEKERKITSAKTDVEYYGLSAPITVKTNELKMQEWGVEGNAIYSLDQVYFPFGAHISFISIKGDNADIKNQSGFGVQGGVGYQPTGWFAAELGLRTTSVSVKYDQAKENTVLTGSGITLLTKILF